MSESQDKDSIPLYNATQEDIARYFAEAKRLVEECGQIISSAIENSVNVEVEEKAENKGEGHGSMILTQTDSKVEKHLIDGLGKLFPDHKFIGEETVSEDGMIREFTNYPTWIIDPIDGTMNFVHSNPLVCTSIGLTINKKLVLGIVNCPMIGLMYSAILGQGAKLNGKPISVSRVSDLSKAMVIMELPTGAKEEKKEIAMANLSHLMAKSHSVRAPGPAAMDISWVGGGSADCFFHQGIHCWDMAAGALIVKEAGGVALTSKGAEFDLMSRGVLVASNMSVAKQVLSFLKIYETPADYPEPCLAL